ncbi:MAG: hypothetical protein EBX50_19130 [Chitinophagia bacterium]|nr:hypothetical protein [Chitinophagia bacterium]
MAILYCLHNSQGLDIKNKKYLIFINHNVSQYDLCLFREHPLNVIVPSSYLADRIILAFPEQIAPPFALQYLFPWFLNIKLEAKRKILDAITYVNNNSKNPDISPWYQEIKNMEINMKKQLLKTESDST